MGFFDRLKKKPRKVEKISGDSFDDFIKIIEENSIPRYDISKPPGERHVGSFATFTPEELLEMKEKVEAKKQEISCIIPPPIDTKVWLRLMPKSVKDFV